MEKATTKEEVEQRIKEWHEKTDVKVSLHEYLGWTKDQYTKFLETGTLPDFSLKQLND